MSTLPTKSNGVSHNLLVDETITKEYTGSGLSGSKVIVRKYGHIVFLVFQYTGGVDTANTWYDICTLDEEFRPSENVSAFTGVYSDTTWYGKSTVRLQVLTSGLVRVEGHNTEHLERNAQMTYIIA